MVFHKFSYEGSSFFAKNSSTANTKHIPLVYGAVMGLCLFGKENRLSIYNVVWCHVTLLAVRHAHALGLMRRMRYKGAGDLFKYLVSKQVESIDCLQRCFSQAHRAVKVRNTLIYTTYNKHISLTWMHDKGYV